MIFMMTQILRVHPQTRGWENPGLSRTVDGRGDGGQNFEVS